MHQPKVNQTQKYSDSQGEHIVHEGKLLLLDTVDDDLNTLSDTRGVDCGDYIEHIRPIIISETEDIEVGDFYIFENVTTGKEEIAECKSKKHLAESRKLAYKILALPEHFSDKHLQAIVDGKMKDGDKVLVKIYVRELPQYDVNVVHMLNNHITLFPAQQSLEEASERYIKDKIISGATSFDASDIENAFKAGAEWAVKNNYKGE